MKKQGFILLALVVMVTLTACGGRGQNRLRQKGLPVQGRAVLLRRLLRRSSAGWMTKGGRWSIRMWIRPGP